MYRKNRSFWGIFNGQVNFNKNIKIMHHFTSHCQYIFYFPLYFFSYISHDHCFSYRISYGTSSQIFTYKPQASKSIGKYPHTADSIIGWHRNIVYGCYRDL